MATKTYADSGELEKKAKNWKIVMIVNIVMLTMSITFICLRKFGVLKFGKPVQAQDEPVTAEASFKRTEPVIEQNSAPGTNEIPVQDVQTENVSGDGHERKSLGAYANIGALVQGSWHADGRDFLFNSDGSYDGYVGEELVGSGTYEYEYDGSTWHILLKTPERFTDIDLTFEYVTTNGSTECTGMYFLFDNGEEVFIAYGV